MDRRRFLGSPLLHPSRRPACTPAAHRRRRRCASLAIKTDGVKTLLWAQQQNLFAPHGLAIDLVTTGSSAASLTALIGGSADIAAGSLFPTFAAVAHDIPVKFIAPEAFYLSDHADSLLLVKADSPIRTARDLNGKVVGVDSLKDVYTLATRGWVDNGGGDGASIKTVELPPPEFLAALVAGRIDAGVFKTPFASIALAGGKARLLGKPLDAIAPRFLLSAWLASADFIQKNPQAVKAYQTVMADAARYTNAHQDETVDLVANLHRAGSLAGTELDSGDQCGGGYACRRCSGRSISRTSTSSSTGDWTWQRCSRPVSRSRRTISPERRPRPPAEARSIRRAGELRIAG